MASETPPFWWQAPDWRTVALAPAAYAYGRAARSRLAKVPTDSVDVPILRIGDLAVGAAGKTQTAMAFARWAKLLGSRPGIICTGPSGSGTSARLVDPAHDSPRHIGAHIIEMASTAPVAISPDRGTAARLLAAEGCDLCIIGDGDSAHPVHAHYTLLVIDAGRGLGNEHVIPAGPLRGSLTDQIRHADAVLRIGQAPGAGIVVRAAARAARPVYEAAKVAKPSPDLIGCRVLAFTATKDLDGFCHAVEAAGADLIARQAFTEGRYFSAEELGEMQAKAKADGLELITTRRDAIMLGDGEAPPEGFMDDLHVLDMTVEFELDTTAPAIITATVEAWRQHRRLTNGAA